MDAVSGPLMLHDIDVRLPGRGPATVSPLKHQQAAALVRHQVTSGTLPPGANIRALRYRHGMTQAQLAALMGWGAPSTVCAAEGRRDGRQRGFTPDEITRLAGIFHLTPARLLSRCANCEGHPPPGYACLTCGVAEQIRPGEEGTHVKSDKPWREPVADADEWPLTYTPWASEHDLIYGYVCGLFVNGHGAEPWLVRPLSAWTMIAEAELERRGLLKKAKCVYHTLLKQHREDDPNPLQR